MALSTKGYGLYTDIAAHRGQYAPKQSHPEARIGIAPGHEHAAAPPAANTPSPPVPLPPTLLLLLATGAHSKPCGLG